MAFSSCSERHDAGKVFEPFGDYSQKQLDDITEANIRSGIPNITNVFVGEDVTNLMLAYDFMKSHVSVPNLEILGLDKYIVGMSERENEYCFNFWGRLVRMNVATQAERNLIEQRRAPKYRHETTPDVQVCLNKRDKSDIRYKLLMR